MKSAEGIGGGDDCGGCPLVTDRRDFFRKASAFAVTALALSLPIRSASAKVLATAGGTRALSYPIPATDGAEIDHENGVILVRHQNEVFAFDISCPHQNTELRWNDSVGRFQCPRHHSQYTAEGEFISGRATRNMDRLGIRRGTGNVVLVDPDTGYQSDIDEAQWKAAVVKL